MSNPADGASEGASEATQPQLPAAEGEIEHYETDDGVVVYDAANPLAWIYSDDAETVTARR